MKRQSVLGNLLRRLALLGLTTVFTAQTAGCHQSEAVAFDRQAIAVQCATAEVAGVPMPDGSTRSYFAVPQEDGSVVLEMTDTHPDGTEDVSYEVLTEAGVPAHTQTLQPDGSVLVEFADGRAPITMAGSYDPYTGVTSYDVINPVDGSVMTTIQANGFGIPTPDGAGDPTAKPQLWGWVIVAVVVIVVVVVAANVYCQNTTLPNLLTLCANLCKSQGQGFGAFTGYCTAAGSVSYGNNSAGGGGVATTMTGCYCLGGPVPGGTVPPPPQIPGAGANPDNGLDFDAQGECVPKVPAGPGAQENR